MLCIIFFLFSCLCCPLSYFNASAEICNLQNDWNWPHSSSFFLVNFFYLNEIGSNAKIGHNLNVANLIRFDSMCNDKKHTFSIGFVPLKRIDSIQLVFFFCFCVAMCAFMFFGHCAAALLYVFVCACMLSEQFNGDFALLSFRMSFACNKQLSRKPNWCDHTHTQMKMKKKRKNYMVSALHDAKNTAHNTISKLNGRHNISKSIFRILQQQLCFFFIWCTICKCVFVEKLIWLWIVCRCRRWRCALFDSLIAAIVCHWWYCTCYKKNTNIIYKRDSKTTRKNSSVSSRECVSVQRNFTHPKLNEFSLALNPFLFFVLFLLLFFDLFSRSPFISL